MQLAVTVTSLRGTVLSFTELAEKLMARWKLDQVPDVTFVGAEVGRETGLHVPRVEAILSADFAAMLDSPWGIDAVKDSICKPLNELLRVNTIAFSYKVSDAAA
jgi:hypothetical protein